MLSNGLSEIRIAGYIKWLKIIAKTRGKKLIEFDKDDVKYVINHFQIRCNRGEISQSTVFEVKKTLKKFFKWYDKGELETPEEIETPEVREIPKVEKAEDSNLNKKKLEQVRLQGSEPLLEL